MQLVSAKIRDDLKVEEDLPKWDGIKITEPVKGLKVWRNPLNKFVIGRLHYTADPHKRTKEWKVDAKSGISYAQFMREYEIFWSGFEGVPVYLENYSKEFHVSGESLQWAMEYPVLRGWDFGLDVLGMACVFAQLVSNSRLVVYRELVASDTDIQTFAEAVRKYSLEWFPGALKWLDFVDPSGFNRNAAARDKASYVTTLRDTLKAKPIPGEKSIAKRIQSVVKFLSETVRGQPKLWIDGVNCPVLTEGFDGGYHFPFNKDGQVKDQPMKNEHSHVHDALQTITSRVMLVNLDDTEIPLPATPQYSFGKVA